MATKVISMVYPVAGGMAAALTTAALLQAAGRFVVGDSNTPSGREDGGTALVWTALRWGVSVGVGLYAGDKLIRPIADGSMPAVQPAQS